MEERTQEILGVTILLVLTLGGCKAETVKADPPVLNCTGDLGRTCVLEGVVKQNAGDYAGAMVLYEATCEANVVDGCVMAANILRYGLGTIGQDEARALRYYQMGCKVSHAGGCHHLGTAHRMGALGAKKDLHRARALLKKACDGGESGACDDLAALRKTGR